VAGRYIDFSVVFCGLMGGELSPDQACALFRENKEGAKYYLGDRLGEIMRDPGYKDTVDLDCAAGRLLESYWKLFGPSQSITMFPLFEIPLVECFIKVKLNDALDQFSEKDLQNLARAYWDKPMHPVIRKAQARALIPLSNLLLRNPAELNKDIAEVKNRVSAYHFTPELNDLVDKVEADLAAGGDEFDQAAILKHLRTFFEKLHAQVALTLRARRPETVDGTDLTRCQQVIDYLCRKDLLTESMYRLGRALYGVLSEEGVHALKSAREYVRFCRNWVAEYALVLFFELDRRLQA
jgi:hypothetical protein